MSTPDAEGLVLAMVEAGVVAVSAWILLDLWPSSSQAEPQPGSPTQPKRRALNNSKQNLMLSALGISPLDLSRDYLQSPSSFASIAILATRFVTKTFWIVSTAKSLRPTWARIAT